VTDSTRAINCGSACAGDFPQGQAVTLTATPDTKSNFAGWAGGCAGTTPTCTLTVGTADATVTATFTPKPATLTVRHVGPGTITSSPAGISCGTKCRSSFRPGPATLRANASKGAHFDHWTGSCHGKKPSCTLQLAAGGTANAIGIFATNARKK
jgi:uncharacterized repeat protein (TIGR02543 family)